MAQPGRARWFLLVAYALETAVSGCAARPPPHVDADVRADERSPARPTTLTLDKAEPFEVLVVAEQLLGEPVLVEAMALTSLRCITVTVKEATPLPPRDAAARLFDALRAQGLRVHQLKGTWTVGIDSSRPPAACAPGRTTAAGEAEARAGAPRAAPLDDEAIVQEVLASIREISPTEHAVKRRGLDLFLEHEAAVMGSLRIVPEMAGGKPVGVRLFGVRPDGVFGRLGFENGDRIERVMGKPLTDPESALGIYATMRNATEIPIEISRRGNAKTLMVRIE